MQLKTYTKRERNMFMIALFGQNILFNIMSIFGNYYLKDVLFIPAGIVAVILVAAQLWDAFNDPIMGTFVDRMQSKRGKCRPFLLVAPGLIFGVTMFCFLCGQYDYGTGASAARNAGVVAWATIAYILWDMVYTIGDIPLWGISSLMTEDEKHRRKLQAYARTAAGIGAAVAILTFQSVGMQLGKMLGSERKGFILAALIYAFIGCATFQLVGIFVKEKITPPKSESNVLQNFKMAWQNKPFRQLLVSGVIASPRNLTMIVAFALIAYYFASRDPGLVLFYTAFIGGGLFGGMFVGMNLVPKLLSRYSKKTVYNASNMVEAIPSLLLFVCYLISMNVEGGLTNIALLIPTFVIFTVKGVCTGIFTVLQTNMISDTVDYEDYLHGLRPDGVFFSGQTFLAKISNGLSNLIYQTLCAAVLFSGVNVQALQDMIDNTELLPRELMQRGSEKVVHVFSSVNLAGENLHATLTADRLFWFFTMMFFCISVLPAIASVLCVIPTWNYELTDERHQEILLALQERRREKGELAAD